MTWFGDGSGISWAICKQSAPCCRQITTPTSHRQFLHAGCSSWRPTNSVPNTEGLKDFRHIIQYLFCSLVVLDPRVGHTMDVLSPFISVILIDSSTESPVHVLMLSIQAVRGLPRSAVLVMHGMHGIDAVCCYRRLCVEHYRQLC